MANVRSDDGTSANEDPSAMMRCRSMVSQVRHKELEQVEAVNSLEALENRLRVYAHSKDVTELNLGKLVGSLNEESGLGAVCEKLAMQALEIRNLREEMHVLCTALRSSTQKQVIQEKYISYIFEEIKVSRPNHQVTQSAACAEQAAALQLSLREGSVDAVDVQIQQQIEQLRGRIGIIESSLSGLKNVLHSDCDLPADSVASLEAKPSKEALMSKDWLEDPPRQVSTNDIAGVHLSQHLQDQHIQSQSHRQVGTNSIAGVHLSQHLQDQDSQSQSHKLQGKGARDDKETKRELDSNETAEASPDGTYFPYSPWQMLIDLS